MSKLPAKLRASLEERFWEKVDVRSDDCWPWTGGTGANGYGKISRGRRGEGHVWAHRAAWEVVYGPIPDGMQVLHHCDNTICVRPTHLWLGDRFDNMSDAASKGRCRTQKLKAAR